MTICLWGDTAAVWLRCPESGAGLSSWDHLSHSTQGIPCHLVVGLLFPVSRVLLFLDLFLQFWQSTSSSSFLSKGTQQLKNLKSLILKNDFILYSFLYTLASYRILGL